MIRPLFHDIKRLGFSYRHPAEFKKMQNMRKNTQGSYSFKPFDETKSIFVHIPKAAGISVCSSLYGNYAGGHTSINRYQYVFSQKDFDSYFKFTFVRNPWERLYSAYTFLVQGGFNDRDKQWAKLNLSSYKSFNEFVLEWLCKENVNKYIHFVPQVDFITFDGKLDVGIDFIGYFENIREDFQFVCDKLCLKSKLSNTNNTNNKGMYFDHYDDEMIERVSDVYSDDIELLGYTFDNT
jgi:hypothetical protein